VLDEVKVLLERDGVSTSLLVGALLAASLAVAWKARRRTVRLGGVAVCIGTFITSVSTFGFGDAAERLLIGLPLLAGAGHLARAARWRYATRALVAVPGAAVIGIGVASETRGWLAPVLVLFTVLAAASLTDPHSPAAIDSIGLTLLAITFAGIYVTVPDTEDAALVLAVAAPFVAIAWPVGAAEIGSGGAAACAGIIAWLAGTGGYGRSGSVLGALACIGLLGAIPLLTTRQRRQPAGHHDLPVPAQVMLIAIHLAIVFVASRVAGLETSAVTSGLIALVALTVGIGLTRFALSAHLSPRDA
jgi:hypothetical protein